MPVKQLSADDFEDAIKDKKTHLLDVREEYEFNAGYIKGAKLIPATNFNEHFEKLKIKKNDKIALYCQVGNRSDFIGKKLNTMGFENVYNLELGLLDWMDQKKKIENKKQKAKSKL